MKTTHKIVLWLYACCFMVFAMAVIGAITRLTESGLSITEWRPVTGALPPLNEEAWQHAYDLYRQSPEFAHKHHWMALADFKAIFFWEWLHRLWGRLIGLVYALPLLWFFVRKQIPAGYGLKFLGVLALGGLQGFVGWWMVKSGLVDRPDVSHFRLAAHLGLALVIFSAMYWLALDLRKPFHDRLKKPPRVFYYALFCLALLAATIIWGAFVAGLDAGKIYNSFPLMNHSLTPDPPFSPAQIIHDHGWIQFAHRWLAILTGACLLILAFITKDKHLGGMVFVQIGLGIATLLLVVAIALAALHQAGAIILLGLTLRAAHQAARNCGTRIDGA